MWDRFRMRPQQYSILQGFPTTKWPRAPVPWVGPGRRRFVAADPIGIFCAVRLNIHPVWPHNRIPDIMDTGLSRPTVGGPTTPNARAPPLAGKDPGARSRDLHVPLCTREWCSRTRAFLQCEAGRYGGARRRSLRQVFSSLASCACWRSRGRIVAGRILSRAKPVDSSKTRCARSSGATSDDLPGAMTRSTRCASSSRSGAAD